MDSFPPPIGGASLLLSFKMRKKTMLIVGGDALAASRAYAALEADADVLVLVKGGLSAVCEELKWRADKGQVIVIDWTTLPTSTINKASSSSVEIDMERDIATLDNFLTKNPAISLVCVTDTISPSPSSHQRNIAPRIVRLCQTHRIPVNVTDMPELCDFSFTATHRFVDAVTGAKSGLQVGVTTNGEGCRLGGRVRRDVVASLPKEVGGAVYKVGQLRRLAREQAEDCDCSREGCGEEGEDSGVNTPNRPVPIRSASEEESRAEGARRRMKWVAQVSEYWPISRLASMTEKQMREILNGGTGLPSGEACAAASLPSTEERSQHGLELASSIPKKGRILLVGSGPGHPSLLTLATHNALTKYADLVLSDKLVPAAVLDIIPRHVEVRIARKFPGNADGAQSEMMEAAVEAASRGLTVVRLKQGDPVVYGRAGEEVLYFREHGFESLVVPGVSSALAAPTFAGIPVTQRGVAETFIVCTGVGRQGKEVRLPGYERARTVLILMGVARLGEVVGALTRPLGTATAKVDHSFASTSNREGRRDGLPYPSHLPIAIIERGSMPDQRVIVSTLADIQAALASIGEQRPPAMMVVGWSVLALSGRGDVRVLEEGEAGDEERVRQWLGGRKWHVYEGVAEGWSVI
ncbi:uroporphyrin-III C-methyltransferase [Phlebopus sp. FC_14]|nr:uroporphyrin-III C-methyltransferase [Phlebopus sp. FC_14]